MEFLFDYLGFLAKTATVVVAALVIISAAAAASAHRAMRRPPTGHIEVVALNERLQDMGRAVEEAALPAAVVKRRRRQDAKQRKRHRKEEARAERRQAKARAASEKRAKAAGGADEAPPASGGEGGKQAAAASAGSDQPQAAAERPAQEEVAAQTVERPTPAEGTSTAEAKPPTPAEEPPAAEAKPPTPAQAPPAAEAKPPAPAERPGQTPEVRRRVFVLTFNGDIAASAVDNLRIEVSAVLGAANDGDEVVVRVESAGGTVHGYGLGASQLARVRGRGVALTVAVDKVAASGGYLMAAVADRILAAPFAVVGSIGVLAQVPNVHRLLKKHDVDVEVLTAGRFKRTLDVFGENTEEGREKLRDELADVHALFQEYVGSWRPKVDLEQVATGEAWYGQRALDRALVDELITSDEYLARACEDADVFEVAWVQPKRPIDRLLGQAAEAAAGAVGKGLAGLFGKAAESFKPTGRSFGHTALDQTKGEFR